MLRGLKTFEIRLNDRDFRVGDLLELQKTLHTGAEMRGGAPLLFTGRTLCRTVSHVLTGYGLQEGWCCLSLRPEVQYDRTLRIRELQAELRQLLDAESATSPDELKALKDECVLLLKAGRTMEAVKLYRDRTSLSLIEARDAVFILKNRDESSEPSGLDR